ncbi:MAG: hypothetical protein ACOC0U_04230, partial [Desulfovibrionales bacterium]
MADEHSLTDELKERLDVFFGEDDDDDDLMEEEAPIKEKSELEGLNSAILSLEWEITDADLQKFLKEVERLRTVFEQDSINTLFLKLLESIGKYIRAKKANAHPNAISLLNNAFQNFSQSAENKEMSENEKKTLLLKTINEFKEVKSAIAQEKKAKIQVAEEKPLEPEAESASLLDVEGIEDSMQSNLENMPAHEAFAVALQEIKRTIEREFE